MVRALPFCLLAVLLAVPARADELRLRNGDRITGTATSLAEGTLIFKVGEASLKIPWTDVVSLAVEQPIRVTVGTAAPVTATFAAADAAGQVTLLPGPTITLRDIVALSRPEPPWTFTAGASASVIDSTGNSEGRNFRLSGDFVAKGDVDRYTVSAIARRSNDNGVEEARNWTTTGRYDRFLTKRFYANATADFTNDQFRDIDLRTALGGGLGYQIIDTKRTTLALTGGLARVYENFISFPDDAYTAAHESGDFRLQIVPDRVSVFQEQDGYFGVAAVGKGFVRLENGVRLALVRGFVTTIEYDVDYDRDPVPGRLKLDRTFSLTLGYKF